MTPLIGTVDKACGMDIGATDIDVSHRGMFLTVAGKGDRVVFADPRATVSDLVRGLGGTGRHVLVVHRTGAALPSAAVLGVSDLRSGDVVALDATLEADKLEAAIGAVTVSFLSGPNRGRRMTLTRGENRIGRAADNDIIIVDPGVSRYHASINVDTASVRVTDTGSTNGVLVGDKVVDGPTKLTSGDRLLVGQTWFAVEFDNATRLERGDGEIDPRRVLVTPGSGPYRAYQGERVIFPTPPERQRGWRRSSNEGFEAAANLYERSLQSTTATLVKELDAEWTARLAEAPSIDELVEVMDDDIARVWPRSVNDPLITRIGLAALPSRIRCAVPEGGDPDLQSRAQEIVSRYSTVDGVPVNVDFSSSSSVLVAGHERESRELAYSLLAQLVLQHQPNRLRIWSLISPARAEQWDWLKWLPHCDGFADDGSFTQLTADPAQYEAVVERLAASVNGGTNRGQSVPPIHDRPISAVLLVDGDAQVPNAVQATIESLVGGDSRSSVTALVVGQSDPTHQLELPFGRRGAVVIVDRDHASAETVVDRDDIHNRPAVLGIGYELYTAEQVGELARRLTCVEPLAADASAEMRTATPSMFWTDSVTPIADSGREDLLGGTDPSAVLEHWNADQPAGGLVARIGRNKMGPVHVDIRELGPHALVSGDLEGFLPAWISSLATRYRPSRLNFYLIDSTGGSVFRGCRQLPHTIGNLSDTSTLEIKPALAMLSAELDRREALLTTLGCNSIEELERQGGSDAVPYLVVCIDRIEALGSRSDDEVVTLDPAAELLSLAERGQQLGMHLMLGAAGSIDPRLAERIALRINAARHGPSHLVVGQAPAVSFTATLTALPAEIVVRSFRIDDTSELSRELLPLVEQDDLEELTTLIRNAHQFSGDPLPSGLG